MSNKTAILRDGLPVAIVDNDPIQWFHREHSFSMDWAIENEGYSLETRADLVRGWEVFHLFATRRGYGVAGSLARLAVEIQKLITAYERDAEAVAGEWRDYVAAPEIAAMLRAFIALLSSTGKDAGSFDIIRGKLWDWADGACKRIGEELDA